MFLHVLCMLNLSFTCSPFQYQFLWHNIMTVFSMIFFQTAGLVVHFFFKIYHVQGIWNPLYNRRETVFIFKVKFNELHGCHIWYGATDSDGYGVIRPTFSLKRQIFTVHRLIYYLENNCHFYNIHIMFPTYAITKNV